MTANQTQMAVAMLLQFVFYVCFCVPECDIINLCFLSEEGDVLFAVYFMNITIDENGDMCFTTYLFLCAVMRSMSAPILSTAMESVNGLAVKHCVRTWDSLSSKLTTTHKYEILCKGWGFRHTTKIHLLEYLEVLHKVYSKQHTCYSEGHLDVFSMEKTTFLDRLNYLLTKHILINFSFLCRPILSANVQTQECTPKSDLGPRETSLNCLTHS